MTEANRRRLQLSFHGRIIDHLGIQMYQSPVAAVAEMVANAWDAEAENVDIQLPDELSSDAEIVIEDDGIGMTFEDCQQRYLNVGYDRRQGDPNVTTPNKHRPVLGRKGIGKFASFGIAKVVRIETISQESGEKTVFELDISQLRTGEYIGAPKYIDVIEYSEPSEERKKHHGTIVRLSRLELIKRPSASVFRTSMARRFLLHQRVEDFQVYVNSDPITESESPERIEFVFPRDYLDSEKPKELVEITDDGWGVESIANGKRINWRYLFYEIPIDEEELRGIAIFANGKLAQAPFMFKLVGGLGGQQGLEYLSGQVEADYLDRLEVDLIATERQRVNWGHKESQVLLEWGQKRVKTLLRIWQNRRAEKKAAIIEDKLEPFANRLERLPTRERKVIRQAILRIARIPSLNDDQFIDLSQSMMLAWERGRLRELIDDVASVEDMTEAELLDILLEAQVLTALQMAEAVKAKLETIRGLEERIQNQELENAVRDYIAGSPWLISPEWETFRVERRVTNIINEAAKEAGLDDIEQWPKRVDLVLSSGNQLLIVEFMRPGLMIDWDHIERFERYIREIRIRIEPESASRFEHVTGYVVADRLHKSAAILGKIRDLAQNRMYAITWIMMLSQAEAQWSEFLDVLVDRAPDDERMKTLIINRKEL